MDRDVPRLNWDTIDDSRATIRLLMEMIDAYKRDLHDAGELESTTDAGPVGPNDAVVNSGVEGYFSANRPGQ